MNIHDAVKLRALRDNNHKRKFRSGDEFDLPFTEACSFLLEGIVEPILNIKPQYPRIPKDDCSLWDAFYKHLSAYPNLDIEIPEPGRRKSKIGFRTWEYRKLPNWDPHSLHARKRRVRHPGINTNWMGKAKFSRLPTIEERLVDYKRAVHMYLRDVAIYHFLNRLTKGHLVAKGVYEPDKKKMIIEPISKEWWKRDLNVNVSKDTLIEPTRSKDASPDASWTKVNISQRFHPKTPVRNQGGRPSSKDQQEEDFKALVDAGFPIGTLKETAETIVDNFDSHKYGYEPPAWKTVAKNISSLWNQHFDRDPNT